MFDTHMHCNFSVDSKMTIQQATRAAQNRDLGIVITEHMDLDYPTNPLAFVFDVPEYFAEFGKYRSEKLLLGIELGMQPSVHLQNRAIAQNYDFDMIIGSIHVAGGIDVYMQRFYQERSKEESYGIYFADMLACVQAYQDYDALGHIDYICRYAPYADTELEIDAHREVWAEICRTLIANGKVPEINTRRLDSPRAVQCLQPFYELYRELGGHYVTLGSDSHSEDLVGCRIAQAFDWAESMRLKPVYFKSRQMLVDDKKR